MRIPRTKWYRGFRFQRADTGDYFVAKRSQNSTPRQNTDSSGQNVGEW